MRAFLFHVTRSVRSLVVFFLLEISHRRDAEDAEGQQFWYFSAFLRELCVSALKTIIKLGHYPIVRLIDYDSKFR